MKKVQLTILIISILSVLSCTPGTNSGPITSNEQIVSYGIGYSIGQSIKGQANEELDLDILSRGIRDAYNDSDPAVPEAEIKEALNSFRLEQMAKRESEMAKREEMAGPNLKTAEDFLKENAKKEGIRKIDEGIQYEVIKSGTGKSPKKDSDVIVHYRGTTIDGNEFDSSYKRGEPANFNLQGVIPGFSKALLKMKEGDKWKIFIHPDLAYGINSPPGIEPNSLLIFEIEVIEVK
jgi:FKBP-type peptidyl-prolyl cis-trans isomerase